MTHLSVIIPTLNEAAHLPGLLDALRAQTRPPDEIIVADAGSLDDTAELARARGARVVRGGMPGPGRNAGARAAQGDIFLFLDADVLPPADFVARAVDEFEREGYVVATCASEALSNDLSDKIIMDATNLYIQIVMPLSPRAPGFCIFARRVVHERIGGFDETLKMSEDHDYVRRAAQYGEFGWLSSTRIRVSMRRLEKEGWVRLALKYLWCEMHALAGKPIRALPFEYEFGAYRTAISVRTRTSLDIMLLRHRWEQLENPVQHLSSAGLEQLRRLTEFDPVNFAAARLRLVLERRDLEVLENYLQQRLALLREYRKLGGRWSRLKNTPGEFFSSVDTNWIRPFFALGDDPLDDDPPES
ncbi:MAG: glycosyltransferase [Chloroflexi bacterium]|nr:glycosyltransferase [Chloroflexota bacterium]